MVCSAGCGAAAHGEPKPSPTPPTSRFFTRLNAEIRAERWERMWAERAAIWSGRGEITINADYVPSDPQAAWWLPELTTASEAR